MGISQRALAESLSVSQMTVSRALRGDPGVSDRLRRRILQAAQQQGYPVAARVRRNAAELEHVVCSIVEIEAGGDETSFNTRLLAGIERGVRESGAELLNYSAVPPAWCGSGGSGAGWPRVVMRRQVDGVVHLFGGDLALRPDYACPVPHVSVFFPVDETSDIASIDNLGGARSIGDYLGARGHRRVAWLGPVTPLSEERLLGLQAGLNAHGGGLPRDLIVQQRHVGEAGTATRMLERILPTGPCASEPVRARFTAIAVYNDFMAAEVITQLARRGLRVPEDVSVTGFDCVRPRSYRGPAITTVAVPLEDLGTEAARLLYWRIDFPTAPRRTLMLSTELVRGETVAQVRT